jgi:hypothetical protein
MQPVDQGVFDNNLVGQYFVSKAEFERTRDAFQAKKGELVLALQREAFKSWCLKKELRGMYQLRKRSQVLDAKLKTAAAQEQEVCFSWREDAKGDDGCFTVSIGDCRCRVSLANNGRNTVVVNLVSKDPVPDTARALIAECLPVMRKTKRSAPGLYRRYERIEQHTEEYMRDKEYI